MDNSQWEMVNVRLCYGKRDSPLDRVKYLLIYIIIDKINVHSTAMNEQNQKL